jgi:hypothetical protein
MQIKTHKMKNTYADAHFFILSKGSITAVNQWKNHVRIVSYVICKNDEEKQKLYWLFYGLWQGCIFSSLSHRFSNSISFRLDDLKNVVKIALTKIELQPQQFAFKKYFDDAITR